MLRRPPPLDPGAPIAVLAPASPPRSLAPYDEGLSRLRETYDVRTAWAPGRERGYLAAPDAERVAALHQALEDPAIRAIICVRGGYGCLRLLSRIDWSLVEHAPTLLVGYSDVTALHLAFYAKGHWASVSGPVVTEWAEADAATLGSFRAWSQGECPPLGEGFESSLQSLSCGTARGPLLGGNLAVLSRLLGTPYDPDFEGAILVLEEVAEAPYRVDRMLAHLQHTGVLAKVDGVVLGHFTTGDLDPDKPTLSLEDVFLDYLADRSYPVVQGLPYGHLLPRCSVPIGVPAKVQATPEEASIEVLSPLVEE